jgi:hypothetical protein
MAQPLFSVVEFVGGPFDGHVELFCGPAERLPEDMIWFVSQNVFRILQGQAEGPKAPVTSIAFYGRSEQEGIWRYCFHGAISPRELSERWARGELSFVNLSRKTSL